MKQPAKKPDRKHHDRRPGSEPYSLLVLTLFACSGATALVYEVLWSKYLALLFGSTIQAQTVVLAVFMGGLALGNRWFGRRADQHPAPLKFYGRLEIAIGIYACLFPIIDHVADRTFILAGQHLLLQDGWLLALKGALSIVILGVPTVLMGGTLPVLAAWLQRNSSDAGRRSARFYSINSLGAVCGAGLAGFVLIPAFGLLTTMFIAAAVNVLIGACALRLKTPAMSSTKTRDVEKASSSSILLRWGCLVVALTGAVSMGLEILASRCLALIVGSSLQAFTIVLMAFILGIGAGSAIVASPRFNRWSKQPATIYLLLAAALFIGIVVFNFINLVEIYRQVRAGLDLTPDGWLEYQLFVSALSIGVLGLPAVALGATLPLWIRIVSASADPLGERLGRLLTWNTLGGVIGVLIAGFVLMPLVGLRGAFTTLAFAATVAALVTAIVMRQKKGMIAGAVVAAFLVLISASSGDNWRFAMTAGVFRIRETEPLVPILERARETKMLFYDDAADATVSVERDQNAELVLRINGKGDASSHGDLSTQVLLAELPLMMKPGAKDVFCFGMGSGITAGTTLGWPIEHLSVAENCTPVLHAAKLFDPWNNGVFTDPRVHVYGEDARTVLKLNPQKYDAIISEPSNPWMVNVGSVFSMEFYQLAASRLKPGGIMTQWFHTYEVDDATFDLVLRTFARVFPAMEIWDAGDGDVILLGSDRPWDSNPQVYQRALALEKPRHDLEAIGLKTSQAILARQLASQQTAFAVAGPGPVQRDDFPRLEYCAPRAMFLYVGTQASRLQRFDERTWQVHLAAPEKNRILSQLSDRELKEIFGEFQSVDPGLRQFVRMRLAAGFAAPPQLRSVPCIFRGTNDVIVFDPPGAPEVLQELADAEAELENVPAAESQAADRIKQILDKMPDDDPQRAGWSAGYYAFLAAEVSYREGNTAEARAILQRGLQLEPGSEELNYFGRILAH